MTTEPKCKLILVAAIDDDRGIGRDGKLAWHHPADLKSFRQMTFGCWLVMGRATWLSLPRPLPDRQTIVLSKTRLPGSVLQRSSLQEAIELTIANGISELYVCGGEKVYEAAIGQADVLALTRIPGRHGCDRFFPEWKQHGYAFHSEMELEGGLRRQLWHRLSGEAAAKRRLAATSKEFACR